MRKFTNLLVSLLVLFGTVISARADVISEPIVPNPVVSPAVQEPNYTWVVILVIGVVIAAIALLRIFHKK